MSHELRTPLAAIYGAAMTLRRKDVTLDEGQRASLLDVVSGEADRLARTVNDILWASRLDTDTLHVTIQNCAPCDSQATWSTRSSPTSIPRTSSCSRRPTELPLVAGDPDKVGRILINLVDNAIKYSPDGGRVECASTAPARTCGSRSPTRGSGSRGPSSAESSRSSIASTRT